MKRIVFLAAAALLLAACTAPSDTAAPSSAPTQAPAATAVPTVAPTAAPTMAPSPVTLLTLKGTGIKNSATFGASGDSVSVAYTFDCATFGASGNFIADLVGSDGSDESIANALSASGSDSTVVYLANTAGPYHVEVNSECSWTVTITGTP